MILPIEERKQIENEMLFRRVNEKVLTDLDDLDAQHIAEGNHELVSDTELLLNFKCECSDEKCDIRIPMKLKQYRKLHVNRSTFIIKPNHEVKPIEKVIKVSKNYCVVRKNNITAEPEAGADFNLTGLDNSFI